MSIATITRPVTIEAAPLAFEPTRRQVFGSHSEMAHVWAQGRVESGRSGDDRMQFDAGTVYSYGRHFAIARLLPHTFGGKRLVLFTCDRRSVSTSKHCGHVRGALHGLDVIVIDVPDLQEWRASPDQVAQAWDGLVRSLAARWSDYSSDAREALDAFRALYCPAAEIPADPKAWVAKRDRTIAADAAALKLERALALLDDLSPPVIPYRDVDLTAPARNPQRQAGVASEFIEDRLKAVRSAVGRVRRAHDDTPRHEAAIVAGTAYVKTWAKLRDAWRVMEQADADEFARASRLETVDDILTELRAGNALPYWLEPRLHEALTWACTYDRDADDVATLLRAVSLEHALAEVAPGAHIVPDWQMERRAARRAGVTPDEWRAGKGDANGPTDILNHGRTMLRRKGDRVETSRGAVVPFAAATGVYALATRVRRGVSTFTAAGQRVGHYTLDAIDGDGNVTIGCHRLHFAEMTALACREAPGLVKPRYPVPALA